MMRGGKMNRRWTSDQTTHARQRDAGIARGPGLLVAAVTAAIVFVIGQQLFPVKPKQPPAPPPAEAGTVAEKAAEAGAATEKKEEAVEAEKPEKAEKPETDKPAAEESDGKPIDKQRQADKDLAREAWRRNRPDISVSGTKTSIMVPIRGSIKGAEFKVIDKKRKVIVTLPKAISMITMRFYSLKHPSFKKVWIDQDEANAQPADGSKLRFILSDTFDPQVEITDDFV